jgi:hypothetical protein
MTDQPKLTPEEWELVIELLERERSELPVEIHHTRNARMREELHQRSKMVHGLLDRVHVTAAV